MLKGVKPGDALPSIEREIDQDLIMRWAELSGDCNRLHTDPEFARQSRFGGTIAHGPMSLAYLNALMMECFAEEWAVGGKLLDVRFVAPIRPGDKIKITGVVKEVIDLDGGQSVECDIFIEKGDGEKAVVGKSIGRIGETPT